MSAHIEYPNFNIILDDSDFETEVNEQIANTQDVVELSYEDFQAKFVFDARVLFDFDFSTHRWIGTSVGINK